MQVCGIGLSQGAHASVISLQPECAAFFNSFPDLQTCMLAFTVKPTDPPKLSIRSGGAVKV